MSLLLKRLPADASDGRRFADRVSDFFDGVLHRRLRKVVGIDARQSV